MIPDKTSIQASHLADLELLRLTAEQIIKDFSFFQLEVQFSGNKEKAYTELYNQVFPHLKHLMEKDHQKFLSLLYHIDLDEKQAMNASPGQVADLVLKRCLQKVVLRKYFSK